MNHTLGFQKVRTRVMTLFSIVLTLLLVLVFVWMDRTITDKTEQMAQSFEKQVNLSLEHLLEHYPLRFNTLLHSLVKNPRVIRALDARDSESLTRIFKPEFAILKKATPYLNDLMVYQTGSILLMSLNSGKPVEERLSGSDRGVRKVFQSHKPLTGFDDIQEKLFYRILMPIQDQGSVKGVIELRIEAQAVMAHLNAMTAYDVLLAAYSEKAADRSALKTGKYRVIATTSDTLEKHLLDALKDPDAYLEGFDLVHSNQTRHLFHLFELTGVSDRPEGVLVLSHAEQGRAQERLLLVLVFFLTLIMLLVLFSIQTNFMQKLSRKLHELNVSDMQKNLQRFHEFYEYSPDMYVSVEISSNRILNCNPAFYRTFGSDAKETLSGQSFNDIFLNNPLAKNFSEDLAEFAQSGQINIPQLPFQQKNGAKRFFSLYAMAIQGDLGCPTVSHVVLHDLTQEHNALQELQFNALYLRSVFDSEPEAMLTTIGEKVDQVNQTFLNFTGYSSEEAFKREYDCICDLFEQREGFLQKHMNGQSWLDYLYSHPEKTHSVVLQKDQTEHYFNINANKMHFDNLHRSVVVLSDITRQKHAEMALQESEARYRTFFENSAAVMLQIDPDSGAIAAANKAACEFYGHSQDAMTRMNVKQINMLPEEVIFKKMQQAKNKRKRYFEVVHRLASGETRQVDVYAGPVKHNGKTWLLSIIHDVTKRKLNELSLKESTAFIQSIFKAVPVGIGVFKDRVIQEVNQHFCEMLGYSRQELIGQSARMLYPDDRTFEEVGKIKYQQLRKNGIGRVETRFSCKDGSIIHVILSSASIDRNDASKGITLSALDISQRVEMEHQLRDKDKLMIAQSRQAAMGDMIAMIAHQWRQPITVIAMAINNLLADLQLGEEPDREKLEKMGSEILVQTEHLSRTIEDFRDFFRPDQQPVQTNIGKVLEGAMQIVGKSLENHNISVTIHGAMDTELETFPNELLQVLLNLINNAKDALEEMGRGEAKLDISTEKSAGNICIRVCDNGGGISEDILPRLGEPYVSSKVHGGTGLGVYMSKVIIEEHLEGTLSWKNHADGACFEVRLRA